MSKKLVIYGASNPSPLKVLLALEKSGLSYQIRGFLDDKMSAQGCEESFGYPVLGGREALAGLQSASTVFLNNVFSHMGSRRRVQEMLSEQGCQTVGLIWPGTDLGLVKLGSAVVIEQNVSIDAFTQIGDFSCLKRSCSVGHETTLGRYVFVGPGATVCGRVAIEDEVYLGAGCVVRDGVTIGKETIVGAGAVVTKDLPAGVVATGNPARVREA